MAKYGIIPNWLIQGYYKGLLKGNLKPCRFCENTTIYINQVEHLEIAYCVRCWASAPIETWQGESKISYERVVG
jgi:hypothetical protein